MRFTRASLLLLLVTTVGYAKDEPKPKLELGAQIDALVTPYVASEIAVGMVVGIYHGETEKEILAGYGRVDLTKDEKPDERTVYEIGSISKAFTGVLLATLAEERKVELDQPVKTLLPEHVTTPEFEGRGITLRDIATQTSALPRLPGNMKPADPNNPYADYTYEQMYAFLSGVELPYAPGERYLYSNVAFALLGHALARAEESEYEHLLEKHIAKPLGLLDTRVKLTSGMRDRLAPPYRTGGIRSSSWDLPTFAAAGGIRSTGRDMLTFMKRNLVHGKEPIDKALALASKKHVEAKGGRQMGLGWHLRPNGVAWHNGGTGGYHTFAAFDPKAGNAVVILSNTTSGLIDRLGGEILRTMRGEDIKPAAFREAVPVDLETLESYVGTYRIKSSHVIEVTVEDGRAFIKATNQPRFRIFPASERDFFVRGAKVELTFEVDDAGKVLAMVLKQDGQEMRGPRES